MLLDAQHKPRSLGPSPSSLAGSVGLHVLLVTWMFFGPSISSRPPAPPKNIYQQLIEPNEKKLVWYNFRDKMPEVSPLQRHGISRPPRSDQKTEKQTIVSNPQRAGKSKQMVYLPAPPREVDHEVEAPNLFAFAVPKLPPPEPKPAAKLFAPPPEVIKAITPPEPLPDAPDVQSATAKLDLPQPDALPKPQAKPFTPPVEAKRAAVPDAVVPDAPKVAANSAKPNLPARQFLPPPEQKAAVRPDAAVPEAPKVAANSARLDLPKADALPRPQPKRFVPPPERKRAARPDPTVPDAPNVANTSAKLNLPQVESLPKPQPKRFVPPPERKRAARPDPAVPDAPSVPTMSAKLTLPQPGALPKPQPKAFTPPRQARRATGPEPVVPDAPSVGGTNTARVDLPQPGALPKPQPKAFTPPRQSRRATGPEPVVPDAPSVGGTNTARVDLPQPGTLPRPQPKAFSPPLQTRRAAGPEPVVPDAPSVGGTNTARVDLPQTGALPRPQPREFRAPGGEKPSPGSPAALPDAPQIAPPRAFVPSSDAPSVASATPEIEVAPALTNEAAAGSLTAAIVGLKPADKLIELPDAASAAQFSSAPKNAKDGGTGEPVETAKIFVPDLMIRDGAIAEPDATMVKRFMKAAAAPTSEANLNEVARTVPLMHPEVRLPGIAQVPTAPDPRLTGRNIYMVAIQMPNVTSYIGSWTMWFADREPMPGKVREMRPPVPTHKVDPKYIASAAAERVEGKVQLSAVIRGDGRVESVSVLQHLDDRLDFAAVQALQKWEFIPAKRDGRTVDVDAIFEIPFRLEPLAVK
jgi:TonB family protein